MRQCRPLLIRPLVVLVAAAVAAAADGGEIRIKDLTNVEGVQNNELVGVGLVVGLNNTGGKSPFTRTYLTNMLQRFGNRIDPDLRARLLNDTRIKTNNVSLVAVTAHLPSFKRIGQTIDITVATMDDATSLFGGELIYTPLTGADDEVYGEASGPVSVDAFNVGGAAASAQKNHPTTGRITNGAKVVRAVCTTIIQNGRARLMLRDPDFETATRITKAVNTWQPLTCHALDPATVELRVPQAYREDVTAFLAAVGALTVKPDTRARVVINERTGTIVIGEDVRLSHVLLTHANLAIFTKESPQVSQPQSFSQGQTVVVPRTEVDVVEEDRPIFEIEETVTVSDLAQALNALGVPPRDLGVIFQQLRDSGALHAELEFK